MNEILVKGLFKNLNIVVGLTCIFFKKWVSKDGVMIRGDFFMLKLCGAKVAPKRGC